MLCKFENKFTIFLLFLGTKTVVDAKWGMILHQVIIELDPRYHEKPDAIWDYSASLPNLTISNTTLQNKPRSVCPEVYFSKNDDDEFRQRNMRTEPCTYVPPFKRILTAVLPVMSWTSNSIQFVVDQIRLLYDIPIVIMVKDDQLDESTVQHLFKANVSMYILNRGQSFGAMLNKVIELYVTTPFVGIFENLAHFNNQSSFERLVRVLDDFKHVVVAAGASRDPDGHWIHGCLQQKESNYRAGYEIGYYFSKYECMYCDDILSPFVVKTSVVKTLKFDEKLNKPAIYRDWFMKLRKNGLLTVMCPDVMFYVTNHIPMTKKDWLLFANKWKFTEIKSYDDEHFKFTCEDIGMNCKDILKKSKSFLFPPCCIDEYIRLLRVFTNYGDENNLEYQLQFGSNLGAVKFGTYLPWDSDMDILIECDDLSKWHEMKPVAIKHKCKFEMGDSKTYFVVRCPFSFLEFYCEKKNSNQYLPEIYRKNTTKIKYDGQWIKVQSNPGLYSRNAVGFEDLRHALHWRHLKSNRISKARGGYLNPGSWYTPCEKPNFHSCLDRYYADGNLNFLHPPW